MSNFLTWCLTAFLIILLRKIHGVGLGDGAVYFYIIGLIALITDVVRLVDWSQSASKNVPDSCNLFYDNSTNLYFQPILAKDVISLVERKEKGKEYIFFLEILARSVVDPLTRQPLMSKQQWEKQPLEFVQRVLASLFGMENDERIKSNGQV